MPRGKTNFHLSNLSLIIPREIHRQVRRKSLRAGAPSLASFVALLLMNAPSQLSAQQLMQVELIEDDLKEKPCSF